MDDPGRILIVDDEPKICQFLEVMLRREGYEATSAYNGADALADLESTCFDLVITDLKMPGMNGFEFVRRVKHAHADVPIIMITGYATVDTAVEALRTGVDDYITKPFNIDELRKVISRTMKARPVNRENAELMRLLANVRRQIEDGQSGTSSPAKSGAGPLEADGHAEEENDLNRILKHTLSTINDNLNARASSIMVRTGPYLELRACEGDRIRDLIGTRLPLGQGIAGYVARERKALLVQDESARSLLPATTAEIYNSPSFISVPILHEGKTLGVINVGEKKDLAPFTEKDMRLVTSVAQQIAPTMSHAVALYATQAQCRSAMEALSDAYEAKAHFLKNHSSRVASYAVKLAKACDARADEIETLRHSAQLHDIGMISVPEKILWKKSRLTRQQENVVREHPMLGEKIVSGLEFLKSLLPVIRHHHERSDGGGYPDGLQGDEIPQLARMLALADAFDAMTAKRPYREALSVQEAALEIVKKIDLQFDAKLAKIFVDRVISSDT